MSCVEFSAAMVRLGSRFPSGLSNGAKTGRPAKRSAPVEEAALGGGERNVQDLGGFLHREFLQLADFDDGSDTRPQPGNGLAQDAFALALDVTLLRIGSSVGDLQVEAGFAGLSEVVEEDVATTPVLAANHEGGINDDAGKPGRKCGGAAEALDVNEGTHQGILHRVFSVLPVPGDVERCFQQPAGVRFAKRFEACGMAASRSRQQAHFRFVLQRAAQTRGVIPCRERNLLRNHFGFLSLIARLTSSHLHLIERRAADCRKPEKNASRDRRFFQYHSAGEAPYHLWGFTCGVEYQYW